jgi:nucleotide-binding universal stress UspA family protein
MKLTIYGTQSSKYEYLKHSIRKTAESAGIEIDINEVMNVQDFIKNDIKSVPAIQMQQSSIIDADSSPSFEAFVNKVLRRILENEKYGKMNTVVLPTDFSPASRHAIKYILRLLKDRPTIFKLLYVYHPIPDVTGINLVSELPDIQQDKLKKLALEFQGFIDEQGSLNLIDPVFESGLAAEKIDEVAKDEQADMIVMSTSGKGDAFKSLFGSVSLEIARRAELPLLLVPPNSKQDTLKKIMFLTNDPTVEQKAFSDLVEFAKYFDAQILIVHVSEKDDAPYPFEWFRRAYNRIETKVILKDRVDFDQLISDYAEELNIDMITMVHGKRSFISSLFHRSISKQMAIHTDFPLMILMPKNV